MLVSIIVATYNCSRFVETTLDSVLHQTYPDLELIVTDDGSVDQTNNVVDQWINAHGTRFNHVVHVVSDQNTGVAANYQRGLEKATGEWVKCLDGDDLLVDDAIDNYLQYSKEHPTIKIFYAGEKLMDDNGISYKDQPIILEGKDANRQLLFLLNHRLLGIRTTTNFFNRELFVSFGGFDKRYPMYQDGPLFLHFLTRGYAIGVLDAYTIKKRETPTSLMHTANPVMVENISRCIYDFSMYYLKKGMMFHYYHAWVTFYISTHRNISQCHMILGYFLRCFDIIQIQIRLVNNKY